MGAGLSLQVVDQDDDAKLAPIYKLLDTAP